MMSSMTSLREGRYMEHLVEAIQAAETLGLYWHAEILPGVPGVRSRQVHWYISDVWPEAKD